RGTPAAPAGGGGPPGRNALVAAFLRPGGAGTTDALAAVGRRREEGLGSPPVHSPCRSRRPVVGADDVDRGGPAVPQGEPATCVEGRRLRAGSGRGLPESQGIQDPISRPSGVGERGRPGPSGRWQSAVVSRRTLGRRNGDAASEPLAHRPPDAGEGRRTGPATGYGRCGRAALGTKHAYACFRPKKSTPCRAVGPVRGGDPEGLTRSPSASASAGVPGPAATPGVPRAAWPRRRRSGGPASRAGPPRDGWRPSRRRSGGGGCG